MKSNKVTMSDIAKEAGVSQSTVSMILNKRYMSFPNETIEKVLSVASKLNYTQKMQDKKISSSCIMIMVTSLTNPYYSGMIQKIEQVASNLSVFTSTVCTYHNPELEASYFRLAIDMNYSGIILLYPPDNLDAYKTAISCIPTITVCDKSNKVMGDMVELNNFQAGSLAARHLLDLGHRKIAILAYSVKEATSTGETRVSGIMSELKATCPDNKLLILSETIKWTNIIENREYHYDIGFKLAQSRELLDNGITGIICVNDLVALGAMDYMLSKGYSIPDDFSIIGSDNIMSGRLAKIPLTSIDLNEEAIASYALTTLFSRIRISNSNLVSQSGTRLRVQTDANLIVRNSTGRV